MAQHNSVAKVVTRYTRVDYTALRFMLNKIDLSVIRDKVMTEDDLLERGIETNAALAAWLNAMRDTLIARATTVNPRIASALADARKFNKWPKAALDILVYGPEREAEGPELSDSVSVWFRPIIAKHLRAEGVLLLVELKSYIERRGHTWYRAIPRIGPGKAKAIVAWLQKNLKTSDKLSMPAIIDTPGMEELAPGVRPQWLPLQRIKSITAALDGSTGINRNYHFCFISARNDLDAIRAYLDRYCEQPKTYRAYQKELERFLLWCVCAIRKPLSSVLTTECEAYKAFLANPAEEWCGPRTSKQSPLWRPFTGSLSLDSQKYAILVLRGLFSYLVNVRYLQGNPWVNVKDPKPIQRVHALQIEKALPRQLWDALVKPAGILDRVCGNFPTPVTGGPLSPKHSDALAVQYRLARAAILLMGMTGIRREEAALATRSKLITVAEQRGQPGAKWELTVVGKGFKERTVLLSARVVEALRIHWVDRGHDFGFGKMDLALLSPVVVPPTATGKQKHYRSGSCADALAGSGFSPDGLYQLLKAVLLRIADDDTLPLAEDERRLLKQTAPHALRHTYATHAAADNMPTDVLQRMLGHASPQTTAIYVNPERTRMLAEVSKYLDSFD